jgi:glutamine---fructose-6-phosphate transaminase (isomerizing)
VNPPLVENILAQGASLGVVASHQFEKGRERLIKSAELIRSSKRIVLSGMGASLYACIPLQYFLASRGVAASVIDASELLHFHASTLDQETAVVLVSRSGETVEVTKLLPVLAARECQVVGVVNVTGSTLASRASETLEVSSPPDQLVPIQTYTGTVVTLLLLGAAYFDELDTTRAELEATIATLAKWIPECYRWSGSWPGFLGTASPLYLLGRGGSLASIHIGTLLLHKVAKMPAVAMSAALFRHGPVEVIDEQFHAVILGSQKATAELDMALAEDIVRMKGNVRWIGPLSESSNIDPMYPWLYPWPTNVPDRFAPLIDVVPLQIAAYQMARWRGIPPGEFRFAPAVTVSEKGGFSSLPVGAGAVAG